MWNAILIREIREDDAEAYLALCNRLDEETNFRMYEPGERGTSPEQQRRTIRDVLAWDNSTILVAEQDGALVGCLEAYGGKFHRDRHSVYIAVGVLQAYTGKGVGTQLFIELERWALEREVHRLELTVMVDNQRAIALYQKMGFEIEGRKRHALRVDGVFMDEYLMARLLD
jgi:RimJ/RimL family protein N-acetyltransferase